MPCSGASEWVAYFSLTAKWVVRSLNRIIEWRGKPCTIRVVNSLENISGKLMSWAEKRGIHIEYIQTGKEDNFGLDIAFDVIGWRC